jgi:hypothetical protein
MNLRLEWLYKKKEATFGLYRPARASTRSVFKFECGAFRCTHTSSKVNYLLPTIHCKPPGGPLKTTFSYAGFF